MRVTRFQAVIAWLLLFAVVVVFVAPSVDLDPTTLGSQQAASIAMTALVAAGAAWSAVAIPQWAVTPPWFFAPAASHFSSLLDLICSRLC